MKDIIRDIITEFHQAELPSIIHRDVPIPELPSHIRKAFVFVGMRRVGKTYLMYQHLEKQLSEDFDKKKCIYLNFEDDRLESFSVSDFQFILDVYFELYPHLAENHDLYYYFDEIQNIDGWEKFIRRLIDKEKVNIFITGSSAKLLSKEIATSLRGRCLETEVFPLSFVEYLHALGIKTTKTTLGPKEKSKIRHHCQTYLEYGGFPETLNQSNPIHHQLIQSYVNTAVFRDVIERYNLQNSHIIKLFLIHCLQNIAAPLSISKVYKTFKSRGETLSRSSLYSYLDYFEDAYLLYLVPTFDLSTRKRQVNPSKIYCADSGIISAYSIKPHMEYSTYLENAVYIELRRRKYETIFYYKTNSGKEIDFIAQLPNGKLDLYQVCLDLNDEKTKQREFSALIEAACELELSEVFVISENENENEMFESDDLVIKIIPYWQWVLDLK